MIADVGSESAMYEQGAKGLRLPDFLAKAETIETLNAENGENWEQMNPSDRLKLRPDIMLVDLLKSEAEQCQRSSNKRTRDGHRKPSNDKTKRKIKIIEIGYGSDTRYKEKLAEKQQQHAKLRQILEAEGHEVKKTSVEILPIILGTFGSVFKCCPKALSSVGISPKNQQKLMRKLVDLSCQSHANILKQRRFLERLKKPPDKRPSHRSNMATL